MLISDPGTLLQRLDQVAELPQLFASLSKKTFVDPVIQSGIEVYAAVIRQILHRIHCHGTNAAFRHIDDTANSYIIPGIINSLQICQDILDLFALIEVHAAYDLIRQIGAHKRLLQRTGLRVGPIQAGTVVQFISLAQIPFDLVHHAVSFLIRIVHMEQLDQLTFLVLRPKALGLPVPVVLDHGICRIQDILRGPVVLLQSDHLRIRKDLFKLQNVFYIRTAEFINRLVVIAHNTDVVVLCRQETHKHKLRGVCILIFIHGDITEPLLEALQDLRIMAEQLHRLDDQIIKIKRVVPLQLALVFLIDPGHLLQVEIASRVQSKLLRPLQLVLCR